MYVCACDDAWLLLLLMLSVSCCCCCYCWCYCHAIYNAKLSLVLLRPVQRLHFRSLMWSPPYSPPFSWTYINRRFKHATSSFLPAYLYFTLALTTKNHKNTYACMFEIQKETAQQASHHFLLLFIWKYQQVYRHVAFCSFVFCIWLMQCAHCNISIEAGRIFCDTY